MQQIVYSVLSPHSLSTYSHLAKGCHPSPMHWTLSPPFPRCHRLTAWQWWQRRSQTRSGQLCKGKQKATTQLTPHFWLSLALSNLSFTALMTFSSVFPLCSLSHSVHNSLPLQAAANVASCCHWKQYVCCLTPHYMLTNFLTITKLSVHCHPLQVSQTHVSLF